MTKRSIYLFISLLLVICVSAHSGHWESSVAQVGTISPDASSAFGRLLFKFHLPEQLNDVTIDYADLMFTATPDTGESYICLMGAFPVTRSWEVSSLSWSTGWNSTGGDYTDSIYSTCLIRSSSEKVTRMDITDIVQMWVDGTLTNYGLIIMPLEDSGRFLKLHTGSALGPDVKAKVRILFTEASSE